jgi:hypothetical protein
VHVAGTVRRCSYEEPGKKGKRSGMSKRKFVLAASLGVIGALLVSGTTSAAVTVFSYTATVSPKKQSAKKFGAATLTSNLETSYTGEFAGTPTTSATQFSKDIKFTPGKLAQCDLSSISTAPDSTAMALCGKSKVGQGSVVVNDGALTGKVTAYNAVPSGGSPTIGFHADLFSPSGAYAFSATGVGVLNTETNVLTALPPPPGITLTHLDLAIGKVKTGKKKGKKTYYVMARCKKKKWVNTATEAFANGSTRSSTSVQKCKAKK